MIEYTPIISSEVEQKAISCFCRQDVTEFVAKANQEYWYWSELKYKPRPKDLSAEEMWAVVKLNRQALGGYIWEKYGIKLHVTNHMQRICHYFDMNFGGSWGNNSIIPSENKERYLISSLIEEAISSSQMEGAVTTRKVAKDMLRKSISPKNKSEQMIYNNYQAIRFITEHRSDELTPEILLRLHEMMTNKTLQDEKDAGRFRSEDDDVVVEDSISHEVVHTPPSASDIPEFIESLCKFANTDHDDSTTFIHPILKAIFLHFLISYVHPFVDGNGRTARAIFYWFMLKSGYWLTEYLSISRIIYRSKASYEKSFLHAEADGNDIGYFANYHLRVLDLAFKDLKVYIERKIKQKQRSMDFMVLDGVNERQATILTMLRDDPKIVFTVKELENRFSVSHTTAKTDVDFLVEKGYVKKTPVNKVKSIYSKGDNFDDLSA